MRFPASAPNVATMISDAGPGMAPPGLAPPGMTPELARNELDAPAASHNNGRSTSGPRPVAPPGRASPQAFAAQNEAMGQPPGMQPPGMQPPGMQPSMHPSGALVQPSAAYNVPGAIGTGAEAVQQRPANIYDTVAHVDAAYVASPVGPAYPQTDWAAAAALPVRVVPPWALALLFVAALGVALGITFAIALLLR
jgi:hypothetical protein